MKGVESRLLPYMRAIDVEFSPSSAAYVADGAPLPGAHSTIAGLVASRRKVRGVAVRPGCAGRSAGLRVHEHLRHFYTTGEPHSNEDPMATRLRGALDWHLMGTHAVPELNAATPWCATSIDLVARRGDRFFVVEHKTGFYGVFDTKAVGRWKAAVALPFAGADIPCTPLGCAMVQGLIGALALHHTFAVPLANITVIVARVWQGWTVDPGTELVALHLADKMNLCAATVIATHCSRKRRKKRGAPA